MKKGIKFRDSSVKQSDSDGDYKYILDCILRVKSLQINLTSQQKIQNGTHQKNHSIIFEFLDRYHCVDITRTSLFVL